MRKDSDFSLLERTVEHKVHAIRIYVLNVGETTLKAFKKKQKSDNGET